MTYNPVLGGNSGQVCCHFGINHQLTCPRLPAKSYNTASSFYWRFNEGLVRQIFYQNRSILDINTRIVVSAIFTVKPRLCMLRGIFFSLTERSYKMQRSLAVPEFGTGS